VNHDGQCNSCQIVINTLYSYFCIYNLNVSTVFEFSDLTYSRALGTLVKNHYTIYSLMYLKISTLKNTIVVNIPVLKLASAFFYKNTYIKYKFVVKPHIVVVSLLCRKSYSAGVVHNSRSLDWLLVFRSRKKRGRY
jgi:hypothetical protein